MDLCGFAQEMAIAGSGRPVYALGGALGELVHGGSIKEAGVFSPGFSLDGVGVTLAPRTNVICCRDSDPLTRPG